MNHYLIARVTFVKGFNTSKEYAFRLYDTNIRVGDYVLTDSANDFVVAKVVNIISPNNYFGVAATKDIICKVDFSAWNRRKENAAAINKLVTAMDKRVKENRNLSLYRELAKSDPELQNLINQYDNIVNGNPNGFNGF